MTISPLHHASLTVTDLDRAVEFYESVLGMRNTMTSTLDEQTCTEYLRLPPGTTGRMAMLQSGRGIVGGLELLEFSPAPASPTPPKRPGSPGLWMVAFEVVDESLAEAHGRLAASGVRFWGEITTARLAGYPAFPMVLFEDSDGNLLELIQLPTLDEIRAARTES